MASGWPVTQRSGAQKAFRSAPAKSPPGGRNIARNLNARTPVGRSPVSGLSRTIDTTTREFAEFLSARARLAAPTVGATSFESLALAGMRALPVALVGLAALKTLEVYMRPDYSGAPDHFTHMLPQYEHCFGSTEHFGPYTFGYSGCSGYAQCCFPNAVPPDRIGPRYMGFEGIAEEYFAGNYYYHYYMLQWNGTVGAEPNVARNYKAASFYQQAWPYQRPEIIAPNSPWLPQPVWPTVPSVRPNPLPDFLPWLDPLTLPIHRPAPAPLHVPYRVLPHRRENPNRAPTEQPQNGPKPAPRPRPDLNRQFETEYGVDARGNPYSRTRPSRHRHRKPDRKTRERKFRPVGIFGVLRLLAYGATEVIDLIDAIYKAIPGGYIVTEGGRKIPIGIRGKLEKDFKKQNGHNMRPQDKVQAIWDFMGVIDWEQAAFNVAIEGAQDRAYGKWFAAGQRAIGANSDGVPNIIHGPFL